MNGVTDPWWISTVAPSEKNPGWHTTDYLERRGGASQCPRAIYHLVCHGGKAREEDQLEDNNAVVSSLSRLMMMKRNGREWWTAMAENNPKKIKIQDKKLGWVSPSQRLATRVNLLKILCACACAGCSVLFVRPSWKARDQFQL